MFKDSHLLNRLRLKLYNSGLRFQIWKINTCGANKKV